MSHRFDRHDPIAFRFLSLIEALDPRTKADREVSRLDKCPGQILVAVLSVAATFAFAVADFLTADTAAVGSKVSNLENLRMSPVSSMIVSARICPITGTVLRKVNSGLSLTRSLTVRSRICVCSSALDMTDRLALTARARSPSVGVHRPRGHRVL